MKQNYFPCCNWCKGDKKAEWSFVYGELPTHDYSYCCTEHIPDLINSISNGKKGEVKFGYLTKWNAEGVYDEKWQDSWGKRWREEVGLKPDNTPSYLKGIDRLFTLD